MRLASYEGGFGRAEGASVAPVARDLLSYLTTGAVREDAPVRLTALRQRAPVPRPGKLVGISFNYRDVIEHFGQSTPEEPILFGKWANSVIGPDAPILIPDVTREPDFEAELGVVIGRTARRVAVSDVLKYVVGYTCVNDVTAGDLIARTMQLTRG